MLARSGFEVVRVGFPARRSTYLEVLLQRCIDQPCGSPERLNFLWILNRGAAWKGRQR